MNTARLTDEQLRAAGMDPQRLHIRLSAAGWALLTPQAQAVVIDLAHAAAVAEDAARG